MIYKDMNGKTNLVAFVLALAVILVIATFFSPVLAESPPDPSIEGFNTVEDLAKDAGLLYPGSVATTQAIFVDEDDENDEPVMVTSAKIDNLGGATAGDIAKIEVSASTEVQQGFEVKGEAPVESFPVTVDISNFSVAAKGSAEVHVKVYISDTSVEGGTLQFQTSLIHDEGSSVGIRKTVKDQVPEEIVSGAVEDTLVIGTTDRVTELSPANSYDHYSWHVLRMCSDGLLRLKPGTDELAPAIAKDWEVGSNAQEYTFHLREGIEFTDGEPLKAQDVKWSFERAIELDGPQGGVFLINIIDEINVIDDYTIKMTLKSPNATFLKRITGQVGPSLIWSPKSTPENEFAKGDFAGVGPYEIKSFHRNESIKYEANENYYGDGPRVKTVIEKKYSNSTELRSAIEDGEIDVAFRTLNPIDIKALQDNAEIKSNRPGSSTSIRYLLFNVVHGDFSNRKVRQAMSYAVDRADIANRVFNGLAIPIYSMVPPSLDGSLETFPEKDLMEAESLLSSAGYTSDEKFKATLWYTPKHYGAAEGKVAQVLRDNINDLENADISIESLDWGSFTESMGKRDELGMFLLGWYPDYLEASNFLKPFTVGSPQALGTYFNESPNYSIYKDIFEQAFATPDIVNRAGFYKEIQRKSADDVMFVPLWSNPAQAYVFYGSELRNVTVGPSMDIRPWLINYTDTHPIPYVITHWNPKDQSIDPDLSCRINNDQILKAIAWWAEDTPVPNTGNKKIGPDTVLTLIANWANDTCIGETTASSSTQAHNEEQTQDPDYLTTTRNLNQADLTLTLRVSTERRVNGLLIDHHLPEGWSLSPKGNPDSHYRESKAQTLLLTLKEGKPKELTYKIRPAADTPANTSHGISTTLKSRSPNFTKKLDPKELTLKQTPKLNLKSATASPNPATTDKEVTFRVEGQGISSTRLEVYNTSGNKLYRSDYTKGATVTWNLTTQQGGELTNGIYLYRLRAKGVEGTTQMSEVKRLLVLR